MKEIQLTQGKVAFVDDEDYAYLMQWKWRTRKGRYTYYAVRRENNHLISMHRVILGLSDKKILVDHKDQNGLNNQRSNIRAADFSQNNANRKSRENGTSPFLGVHWDKRENRWVSKIRKLGKVYYLGRFVNQEDAAKAYKSKATELHGDFANVY